MKTLNIIFYLVIILMGFVSGSTDITCNIIGDKTLITVKTAEKDIIYLPEEYFQLESNREYLKQDNKIYSERNTIKFITRNYIKKVDNDQLFLLPKSTESNSNIKIILPKNYIISDNLVYPRNYKLSTNGENIILEWENNSEEIIIFYRGVINSNLLYYIIIIFSLTTATFILFLQQKKFTNKIAEEKDRQKKKMKRKKAILITKNLFNDEKKIIEFLLAKETKSCWTKELVKVLGISKVKLSRKIRILAEKELIKKEKFGNENKITLN